MSKIALTPNASGTGTFTIASPNSNTNRTLTLPDEAGTVLTDVSDLPAANLTGNVAAARITDALNASGSAPLYACRAWVYSDSGSLEAGGNVSSVTDHGAGDYTINFATSMPDANYAVLATCSMLSVQVSSGYNSSRGTKTTSAVSIVNRTSSDNYADRLTFVGIFR